MRRFLLLAALMAIGAFPAIAQSLDLAALAGDTWYGVYMNGEKVGYAKNSLVVAEDGTVTVSQDASFKLTMVGSRQSMRTMTERRYGADGALIGIESTVTDISGTNTFLAIVDGDRMTLRSSVAGTTNETVLPRPNESLRDSLRTVELVRSRPEIGEVVIYRQFEPMFQQEIEAHCEVTGVETRNLDGVPTKVYTLKTTLSMMGIDSVSYITEEGLLLEDNVSGGLLVMRLEPEAVAKDVTYQNDTIVSNAAMVDAPIRNPRSRAVLRLRLDGPLESGYLIEDGRQSFKADGGSYLFEGRKSSVDGFAPVHVPISNDEVREWLEPSLFVQSGDPKLIAKAREIVGGETNSLRISDRLVRWVYDNVRSTFSARLTNSLEVLESMEGDCTEHSMLYIGLARAAGLPAREVAGLIYVDQPEPGFYFHQWAMVWVGEWIDVDPTFNQPLADATHIKLAEGDLMEQIRLLPLIGQLKVEVLDGD
ncbi:MAG: transglutaminase domain-containing protein [Candidatus Hydrogenedentes bacterium]|nr:transglutaminase domain-containing protein [Candidatus Hydrogenedentota bacterium]